VSRNDGPGLSFFHADGDTSWRPSGPALSIATIDGRQMDERRRFGRDDGQTSLGIFGIFIPRLTNRRAIAFTIPSQAWLRTANSSFVHLYKKSK
jgi:hypothetical protein